MPKKLFAWRLSEDVETLVKQYQDSHKLKNVDEALRLIFQRLQYLEDLAIEQTSKPSGMDDALGLSATPMQWIDQHPCEDRAIVKEKDGFSIYCNGKKIPIEVCVAQQKKAINKQWKRCYSPYSKPPSFKKWKKRTQTEPRTRPYKDQAFNPSDDYFDDDWGH